MARSTTRMAVTVAAGAMALGAGLGLGGLASADPSADPTAGPSASQSAGDTTDPRGDRGGPHGGGFGDELAATLADELGVSQDKVSDALDSIREARQAEHAAALKDDLDDAVADGTLTQAEADAVTKAVEKGVIHVSGRR